jgi:nucleotide-binding universal stress UspA family protein
MEIVTSTAMGVVNEIGDSSISLSNILFAMDFSPSSLRAYPYAADIALHYGGKVFVAHVVPSGACDEVTSAEQVKLDRLLEAAAEAGLNDPRGALRQIPHEVLIDHGDICARLMTTADKFKIDLVVIGTHGWRGIRKLLKGSTAEKITWLATGPVLTVGPRVSPQLGFKRILYATDFLPAAAHAFTYAISLAREFGAELLVLHVNDQSGEEPPAEAGSKTFEFLHKHSTSSAIAGILDRSRVLVDFGPAADLILEHSTIRNVDLIVMGLRHLDGLKARIGTHLPGSTPYELASRARCPVLTVPWRKQADRLTQ